MKIAVIPIEHEKAADRKAFEKSLITYSHLEVLARVRDRRTPKLGGTHNEFLQIVSTFYRTHRYSRYNAASRPNAKEKAASHAFIAKHLKIAIDDDQLWPMRNYQRIRRFIGKTCGRIGSELYDIIQNEATRLNLYTYELRIPSKAAKIFSASSMTSAWRTSFGGSY